MIVKYDMKIDAPAEHVFSLVDNEKAVRQWMTGLVELNYDGHPPDHPVGTHFTQTFRERGRLTEYHGEVLSYEKPRHLGVVLKGAQFSVKVDYELSGAGPGTHLDYTAEFSCSRVFARRLGGVYNWFSRRVLERQMRNLKHVAEHGPPGV